MDPFTVIFGALTAFFVITVLLLGAFSKRSPREFLDWKPTRSPEVEAQNEIDDVAQMVKAQNQRERRRGAAEISEEQMERRVHEDREQMKRWRGS